MKRCRHIVWKLISCVAVACVFFAFPTTAWAWNDVTYQCGFEPNEQGSAFTSGALNGQGTPAWTQNYFNSYDAGGSVTNAQAYSGTQSLVVGGMSSSRLDLGQPTAAPWFEFAYRPDFATSSGGTVSNPNAVVTMLDTRAGEDATQGINMQLHAGTGEINVDGTNVGTFTNDKWQTISFKADVVNYNGAMIYTGTSDVYLNGQLAATNITLSGSAYNGLETIVFSGTNANSNWTNTGTWYIDNINIGDTSQFVATPEPATLSLLGLGGLVLFRRRHGKRRVAIG